MAFRLARDHLHSQPHLKSHKVTAVKKKSEEMRTGREILQVSREGSIQISFFNVKLFPSRKKLLL